MLNNNDSNNNKNSAQSFYKYIAFEIFTYLSLLVALTYLVVVAVGYWESWLLVGLNSRPLVVEVVVGFVVMNQTLAKATCCYTNT